MKTMYYFILSLMSGLLLCSCIDLSRDKIKGNEDFKTENRDALQFNHVVVKGGFDIIINKKDNYDLRLEGESNILDHVESYSSKDTLFVSVEKYINLDPTVTPIVAITCPQLYSITINGAAKLVADTIYSDRDFKLDLNGSGSVDVTLQADSLKVTLKGSGSIELNGNVNDSQLLIAGAGKINTATLTAKNVSIQISGAGTVITHATEKLDISIKGAGAVKYHGDPVVTESISGAGKVTKI